MNVHASGTPPIFIGKHTRSHSGVSEINDARHILSQTWPVTSRTLDFNVVGMRALRVYIKRHLFRSPEHSPSCPTTATLISGGRGRFRAMHIQASFISQTPESMYLFCSQKSTCSCFARAVAVSSRSALAKCSEIM